MNSLSIAWKLLQQYRRNALLVVLIVVAPSVFITMSYYTTAAESLTVLVTIDGERRPMPVWMPDLHGAVMVPIAAAFLSGMAGLFVMLESATADRRLVIAGLPARGIAAARLLMITFFGVLVALLSVTATLPHSWPGDPLLFVLANVLLAVNYGFLGAVVALGAGRLGGAYLMLFAPMIDVGIFQDPMLVSGEQPFWMQVLPGFGGTRLAIDAAFTEQGDDVIALGSAVVWLFASGAVAFAILIRGARDN